TLARVEPDVDEIEEWQRTLEAQHRVVTRAQLLARGFTDDGIRRIAEVAWQVNEGTENIGARRLHTVMERLLEGISFTATEVPGSHVIVDAAYVDNNLSELASDEDLSRFIL
ncbi:MAG: HslU--HslV peptidase ATPase subunit, partial [Sedimenticola sp.]|nr:HslU--HslV peptidase ATPase subunit [Sedimenticola sp.]